MHRSLIRLAIAFAVATLAHAAPRVPDDDAVVLERVPPRGTPQAREIARLRAAWVRGDAASAVALADAHYRAWRSSGDPRSLGRAQAALAAWWDEAEAPVPVLVMRAAILQSEHAFERALRDLDRAIAADPRHRQALLMRATLHTVQGRYPLARADCRRLVTLAPSLYAIACEASVDAATGRAAAADAALAQAARTAAAGDGTGRAWLASLRGEIAHWRGDPGAEAHFAAALAADPGDAYTLAAYADWLLDAGRAADVVTLLRGRTQVDALLLRLAIARRRLHDPAAPPTIGELRARFAALQARGDTVHRREQARFALDVDGDARTALALAQANWRVQREPADLRVLAEAAAAHRDREALRVVRDWVEATGLEHRAVAAALARAGVPPS